MSSPVRVWQLASILKIGVGPDYFCIRLCIHIQEMLYDCVHCTQLNMESETTTFYISDIGYLNCNNMPIYLGLCVSQQEN